MPQYGGGTVRGGYAQAQNEALQRRAMDMQNTVQGMNVLSTVSQNQERVRQQQEMEQLKPLLAQFGGDPEKTIRALLSTGSPKAIELASKLKGLMPQQEQSFNLSPGQRRFDSQGKVIAEVPPTPEKRTLPPIAQAAEYLQTLPPDHPTRPYIEKWLASQGGAKSNNTRTIQRGELSVTEELQQDGTWKEIGSGPKFSKSVAPSFVMPRQQQWKEIADPLNEQSVIVVNPDLYNEDAYKRGDKRGVLGKGQKMTEAGKIDAKTQLMLTGLGSDLQTAEDLLTGVVRTSDGQTVKGNLPTGSGIGSLYDAAAGFIGMSPAGAEEADSLKTVSARLVSRIPRFEGPQSDKDVKLYQQAAGDAGNEKLPRPRRLAGIRTMRRIYEGYESGQRGRLIGNRRAADQNQGAQPRVVDW